MRKILAIWMAKLSATLGVLIGKKSSSTPGAIALKICPDLIKQLKKNIKNEVIVTCGTNGKTTTNNLIYSTLVKNGYKVVCNTLGANMLTGVATAFALECNWFGKLDADYACLEIDEAYTKKVFEHIRPDIVVVTNLFRDQLDRYGEINSIMNIMGNAFKSAGFPALILNGDDPISSGFGRGYEGKTYYFGIGEEVLKNTDEAYEGMFCSVCGGEQKYNFHHYSHLGDYYCTKCQNKRPEIDFEAKNVDLSNGIKFSIENHALTLNYRGFYNIYNILAVYGVLRVLNLDAKFLTDTLTSYKPQIGRMQEINLGKPFILNLAKNPAGFNQAIQTVLQDSRKKDIIIAINDMPSDGTDVSWLWDVEFEKIADESLNLLHALGTRKFDVALRFKYENITDINITDDMKSAITDSMNSESEVCYVLVNYTMLFSTENIMKEIEREGGQKNNE